MSHKHEHTNALIHAYTRRHANTSLGSQAASLLPRLQHASGGCSGGAGGGFPSPAPPYLRRERPAAAPAGVADGWVAVGYEGVGGTKGGADGWSARRGGGVGGPEG